MAELASADGDVEDEANGTVGEVAGASERRDLNYAIGGICGVVFVFTILAVVNFSGAVGDEFGDQLDLDDWRNVPLKDRHLLNLTLDSWRSQLPEDGPY